MSSESARGNIARVVSGVATESGLNKRQAQAVRQALESRLTLIQGPPGTGKTKTACSLVQAAVVLRDGKGARGDGKASVFGSGGGSIYLQGGGCSMSVRVCDDIWSNQLAFWKFERGHQFSVYPRRRSSLSPTIFVLEKHTYLPRR